MHNMKCKKVLAAVLAGTMVLGMGTTAFASETAPATTGNTTGAGEFEGHVDQNKLLVELPTSPAATTFAYTLDPEGLIAATEGAKDKDAKFESTTGVYFLSGEKKYTADSATLKVTNKGTVNADVTVAAETKDGSGVTMAEDTNFGESDTTAKLYLGLKVAGKNAVAVKAHADGTDPVSASVGLRGVKDNFEVKYDEATKKYSYAEKEGIPDTAWNSFEFGLTGACNQKGDFSADGLTAPTVEVTWSYAKRADDSTADLLDANATTDAAPSVTTTTANLTSGQALDINVNLGAGSKKATGIASITFPNASGATNTVADSKYSYADGKITFGADWVTAQATAIGSGNTRTYTVTFDDSASTTGTFTVTAQ